MNKQDDWRGNSRLRTLLLLVPWMLRMLAQRAKEHRRLLAAIVCSVCLY